MYALFIMKPHETWTFILQTVTHQLNFTHVNSPNEGDHYRWLKIQNLFSMISEKFYCFTEWNPEKVSFEKMPKCFAKTFFDPEQQMSYCSFIQIFTASFRDGGGEGKWRREGIPSAFPKLLPTSVILEYFIVVARQLDVAPYHHCDSDSLEAREGVGDHLCGST